MIKNFKAFLVGFIDEEIVNSNFLCFSVKKFVQMMLWRLCVFCLLTVDANGQSAGSSMSFTSRGPGAFSKKFLSVYSQLYNFLPHIRATIVVDVDCL